MGIQGTIQSICFTTSPYPAYAPPCLSLILLSCKYSDHLIWKIQAFTLPTAPLASRLCRQSSKCHQGHHNALPDTVEDLVSNRSACDWLTHTDNPGECPISRLCHYWAWDRSWNCIFFLNFPTVVMFGQLELKSVWRVQYIKCRLL